ncbi:MAG: YjfB family protein [Anaerolineales bacterium]|nr:YjfB family protein [Anaerolineales bacterium]
MNIAASSPVAMAESASALKSGQIQSQVAVAVLKQVQDTERAQAEALLRMIQQTTAAARGGVDVYA